MRKVITIVTKTFLYGFVALSFCLLLAPAGAQTPEGLAPAPAGKQQLPAGAPFFLDPAAHPAIGVEGVYVAEVEGIPGVSTMYVSIRKGGGYATNEQNVEHWVRDNDSDWTLISRPVYPGERAITNGTFGAVASGWNNGGLRVSDEGVITFNHAYGQNILPAGFRVTLKPQGGFDSFAGEWKIDSGYRGDGSRQGAVRMRRLKQTVSNVTISGFVSNSWSRMWRDAPTFFDAAPAASRPLKIVIPNSAHHYFTPDTKETLKANRPHLRIDFFGSEMWAGDYGWGYAWIPEDSGLEFNNYYGVELIRRKNADGIQRIVGQAISLRLLSFLKEGETTIWYNGLPVTIDIDFEWTEDEDDALAVKSLQAIGEDGKPLKQIADGDVFRLRATVNRDAKEERLTATVPAEEGHKTSGFFVSLIRSAKASVFESELLRLERDAGGGDHFKEMLGDQWNGAGSLNIASQRFSGAWDIASPGADGAVAIAGAGEVNEVGNALFMNLGTAENPRAYKSIDLYAEELWENGAAIARLRAVMERRPDIDARLKRGGKLNSKGRALAVGAWRQTLDFTLGDKTAPLKIVGARSSNEKPFKLQLVASRLGAPLDGDWIVPAAEDEEPTSQKQIWVRHNPVEITGVVLIDDQIGARIDPDNPNLNPSNYAYPYDQRYGKTGGAATRMLVVFGKNLPSQAEATVSSDSDNIVYNTPLMAPNVLEAYRIGAHTIAGTEMTAGEDWLVVRATLREEVAPGRKAFVVNQRIGQWGLTFSDAIGTIRFLRDTATPADIEEKQFYFEEEISVGVRLMNNAIPRDDIEITLEAISSSPDGSERQRRNLGRVPLKRVEHSKLNFAISEPFLLRRDDAKINDVLDGPVVRLVPGEKLQARIEDPFVMRVSPLATVVDVLIEPQDSELWRKAMARVAACPGVNEDPSTQEFLSAVNFSTERTILTAGLENRRANVTNGDHAALLLIKDAIIPIVQQEVDKLAARLAPPNQEREALRYLNDTRDQPGGLDAPFWSELGGEFLVHAQFAPDLPPVVMPYNLRDAVDLPALRDRINATIANVNPGITPMDIPKTRDMALRQIALRMRQQYDASKAAVERARNVSDCDVEQLLIIAGQKSDLAVARILPQLVKTHNGRWEADVVARGLVRSVYRVAEETRALEDWADIDDAYKSLAVAAAGAAILSGGALLTNFAWAASADAAAAGVAATLNTADFLYFAKKDIDSFYAGEANYEDTLGLSPAYQAGAVSDAEGRRVDPALVAAGVALGAFGAAGDFEALRQTKSISSGRAVARSQSGLARFDDLDAAAKADVAAYYDYLKSAQNSKTGFLTAQEQADLENFGALFPAPGGSGLAIPSGGAPAGDSATKQLSDVEFPDVTPDTKIFPEPDFQPLKPDNPAEEFSSPLDQIAEKIGGGPEKELPFEPVDDGLYAPPDKLKGAPDENVSQPEIPSANDNLPEQPIPGTNDEVEGLPGGPVLPGDDPLSPGSGGPVLAGNPRMVDRLHNPDEATGVVKAEVDVIKGKKFLRPDTVFHTADGDMLQLGDRVRHGGFSSVYANPSDPTGGTIWKVRRIPAPGEELTRHGDDAHQSMMSLVHDADIGRRILGQEEADGWTFGRLARQDGEIHIVRSATNPDEVYVITKEENLSRPLTDMNGNEVAGVNVTDFAERLAQRANTFGPEYGVPSRNEAITHSLAVRELNQRGIYWLDNKNANIDIAPDATSPTGYRAVFFDHDGFRRVRLTPDQLKELADNPSMRTQETLDRMHWRNARRAQYYMDRVTNDSWSDADFRQNVGRATDASDFDGYEIGVLATTNPARLSQLYWRLGMYEPEEFQLLLEMGFPDRNIPYRVMDTIEEAP